MQVYTGFYNALVFPVLLNLLSNIFICIDSNVPVEFMSIFFHLPLVSGC